MARLIEDEGQPPKHQQPIGGVFIAIAVQVRQADAFRHRERTKEARPVDVPEYWKSDMLPEPMRLASGHGGSHTFLSAEFINALVEGREPVIDVYESLAMTVPGIVAHQSALRNGEQMQVPQFDKSV